MSLLTLFRNLHHLPRRARSPPGPLSALKFFATKMSVPATKQAIAFNQPGDFDVLEKLTIPLKVSPGEIVVKNEYLGINFIDTYLRKGLYPSKEFPAVIGTEAAGVVVQLPTDPAVLEDPDFKKRGFTVGSKVAVGCGTFGMHADYVSLPWKFASVLPEGVSTSMGAAALLQGLTALTFVTESHNVQKGETIFVHTVAGGLGLIFAQLAKARGATVIGTTSTPEKAALAKAHGADHVILYKTEDTVARVMELTNGVGVDAVFDGVGKDTFDNNFKLLKRKGTMVCVGNASGPVAPFAPLRLVEKNLKILRPTVANYCFTPEEIYRYRTELFSLVVSGALKINIHKEYAFTRDAAIEAQQDLTSGKTTGKLLIKVE